MVEKVHANLTAKRAATPHDLHFITTFTLCLHANMIKNHSLFGLNVKFRFLKFENKLGSLGNGNG